MIYIIDYFLWKPYRLSDKALQEGDIIVDNKINWESDIGKALARAGSEEKFVLLDFFNPG